MSGNFSGSVLRVDRLAACGYRQDVLKLCSSHNGAMEDGMTKNEIKEKSDEFFEYTAQFGQKYPEISQSFMALMGSVMEDGALKTKEKELIALGIAVGLRCLPCIYAHTSAALGMGASPEEIMEAASVAILMAGGPGMAHVMEVMKAIEAFSQQP